jgi:biotin carboxyl carrier protein
MSEFIVSTGNKKITADVQEKGILILNGEKFDYELIPISPITYLLRLNNKIYEVTGEKHNSNQITAHINGLIFNLTVRTSLQEKAAKLIEKSAAATKKVEVKAPMPGMILKIKKELGEEVKLGDSVIILEAMKMENDLRAPATGKITKMPVTEGSAVEKGFFLYQIESA